MILLFKPLNLVNIEVELRKAYNFRIWGYKTYLIMC